MNIHNQRSSDWKRLFRVACSLINQINSKAPVIDRWALGGGTAMMIQIGHRESHDVDIFIQDPQFLGFLNPEVQDFDFEIAPSEYGGDGSQFMKFSFQDIGEIDFIVAPELTENPTNERDVEGIRTLLETVPEIIAKKICFRGASITPRDIFDIAAAAGVCRDEVIDALRRYPEEVKSALATMDRLNPEFVGGAISQLMIREKFKDLAAASLGDARKLLAAVS